MHIKYERFFQNPSQLSNLITPWLKAISQKHPNFSFNSVQVIDSIHRSLTKEKSASYKIFPGVFATPIGNDCTIDPKLVPLKLLKIKPGAIIPLHRHGGCEYYQLLPGSKLIDTRNHYNEHRGCVSEVNEIHAVSNIGVTDAYALIALPTALTLEFLNDEDAFAFLKTSFERIKGNDMYQSHQLFIRLLYTEALFKKDLPKAQVLLNELDLQQIASTVQIRFAQRLQAYITQDIEETVPFNKSKL